MPHLLTTSRAARLAGISRGELQKHIRSGELSTFEGEIEVSELLRVFPEARLGDGSGLERFESIKEHAKPRYRDESAGLPSSQVMISRLQKLSEVLLQTRSERDRFRRLLHEVMGRLDQACAGAGELQPLKEWLTAEMEGPDAEAEGKAHLFVRDALLRVLAAETKLIPSGHQFLVEGQESILASALRAGLYVNYGCSSGNCGACKARVVSGEVQRTREHDYLLSEHEKNMGYMLMCSNTAVTDLVIEAAEAAGPDEMPHQEILATALRAERLEGGLVQLGVQTPQTRILRFMAGQEVELSWNGRDATRYPIASCPCDGRNLQFLVRNHPGDPFAERLFAGLALPHTLRITGPYGGFVLHNDSPSPLLLIAFDDGFAPIRSLVEHAISIDLAERIRLWRVTTRATPPVLDGLCRAWNDALDHLDYHSIVGSDSPLAEIQGLINTTPQIAGYECYIAGPGEIVTAVERALQEHPAGPPQGIHGYSTPELPRS